MITTLLISLALGGELRGWRYDGSGHWPEATPPVVWGREAPVLWSTPLPQWSNASPTVAGGKVCVCAEPTTLVCLDAVTGKVVWTATNDIVDAVDAAKRPEVVATLARLEAYDTELKQVRADYGRLLREARASGNAGAAAQAEVLARRADEIKALIGKEVDYRTPADQDMVGWSSPTPVTDGKRVFALFANGVVAAYDLATGKRLWARWQGRAPKPMLGWDDGHASSPMLVGDVLVVPFATLAGLDAATGKLLWEGGVWKHYGTPAPITVDGTGLVLTPDGRAIRARDGKVVREGLADQWYVGPVIAGRSVYYLEARSEQVMVREGGVTIDAWRIDGLSGETLGASKLWSTQIPGRDTFYAAPVVLGPHLYVLTHNAILYTLDAAKGTVLDKRTLDGIRPTTVYASPTVAGDHLFITDEKGFTVVLKGGAPPQVVATHQGWPTRSSPAFVGGKVFLRTEDGVVAAGK